VCSAMNWSRRAEEGPPVAVGLDISEICVESIEVSGPFWLCKSGWGVPIQLVVVVDTAFVFI
jgi:hypothetical protein